MVCSEISLLSLTQSRHGWHPCNYETIKHLKKVRNKLADAYHLHKKLTRILGKSIPNRNQVEFKSLLLKYDGRLYHNTDKDWSEWLSHNIVEGNEFPCVYLSVTDNSVVDESHPFALRYKMNLYHYIEGQVAEAMRPKSRPEDVKPIVFPPNWRAILKAL